MLRGFFMLCLASLFFGTNTVDAKTFTGRITNISTDSSRITVQSTIEKREETFDITDRGFKVTVNRRPGKISDVTVGDLVTIFTSATGQAQRLYKIDAPTPSSEKPQKTATSNAQMANKATEQKADSQWTQFLGPDRKNRSPETGLLKSWPQNGPKLLWTARNLGEGYSAVSLGNGKIFTMGTRAGQEAIIALDVNTGQELWSVRQGEIFQDGQGNGPRSTPTFDNGTLYTLGASGDLSCISERGNLMWTVNILDRFSASNIVWGISESPLIDGDKVIVTPGGDRATMVALNKQSGEVFWQAAVPGNPKTAYASVIKATINGNAQYINFCHNGLFGVDAKTGRALWGDNNASNDTANCSSPIALGNTVFYASGYGTGGALLDLSQNSPQPRLLYKTEKMKNHHGGMVEIDGFIYGANDNILTCLNAQAGAITWQDRLSGSGKGAITYADGNLYFRSEVGPMFLIEANPKEFKLISQFDQPERSSKNAWARPVVVNGKLFLRDQDLLLCYDLTN